MVAENATVHVDPEVLEALRFEVLRKHGKLYGVLRQELDAAIWAHVQALQEERLEA